MKLGYFGFNNGHLTDPALLAGVLRCAESAGFESAWTGEHLVLIDPQRPPSPVPPEMPILDTVAALAFAAGITEQLKLGSGIVLLAQRNPVVIAKELTAVDVLSKGRLIFGVGVGYVKEEFDTLGIPYQERGARVDEHIEVIRTLWTEDKPTFDGRFTQFSGIQSKPMPAQHPHPPIVIGGMSPTAYRRAIRCGDGWYGFNQDEDAVALSIAGLKAAASEAGDATRFDRLEISVTPKGPVDRERCLRFQELGVHRLNLMPALCGVRTGDLDSERRFIEETAAALL